MADMTHRAMEAPSRRRFLKTSGAACVAGLFAAGASAPSPPAAAAESPPSPAEGKTEPRQVFSSDREDGRFVSSTGFIHAHLKHMRPKLAFDPTMRPEDFPAWREAVREKIRELMCFPEVSEPQPPPKQLGTEKRDGYRLEKWEAYPEPYSVVPYLVLIPDGAGAQSPAPAAVCFPGSSSSKESLAGELELNGKPSTHAHAARNRMAWEYTQKGIVTVAVDNPGTCETEDSIRRGRLELCMHGIWAGRPYEGISVFQKMHVLEWLKRQPYVDTGRIAASGHSLGAKPALILGVLDPTLKAVVWNDFVSNWRERAVVMNLERISTHQYVPGMLPWFDYCDLEASLAPRPFLITEGGRTRDIERIREAYKLVGAADRIEVAYYPKYATRDKRPFDDEPMPEGLSQEDYFRYANVDAPMHCFKGNVAVPWLAKVLGVG